MDWGFGGYLKWMTFLTCNEFRDAAYRANGDYQTVKYSVAGVESWALGMNPRLHVMQGYATEVSIHGGIGDFWVKALSGQTADSQNHTIVGAWNYVCRNSQPKTPTATDPVNVARSICWPECQSDYLKGYGPNTTPFFNHTQDELIEIDLPADQ